jgi:MFS family permease
MFVVGALPAFFVLYLRRGLNESEKWQQAVREKRWNATADSSAHPVAEAGKEDKRPFTLKQLFTEREALRRTLLTMLLSIVSTTGWWAISIWLPTFTVTLANATGAIDAVAWGSRISIIYTAGAIVAYLAAGFIVDSIGRRAFLSMTFIGALITTIITYHYTATLSGMLIIAPINGFFTLGCAYAWMAIYPCELFTPTVRSTAISFVFNAARLIAWVFPIISGSMIKTFGGMPRSS